jgi:hypothetical protein
LVGAARRFSLVQVGGAWKIDAADLTTTDVPAVQLVQVTLGGSSLGFDASAIHNGDVALDVRNPTSDVHELSIITVPASMDMADFFAHPERQAELPEGHSMPTGMDFIGGITRIQPGAEVTIVFRRPLPAAHYVLFCNVEDGSDTPHARLGEFTEFTIE